MVHETVVAFILVICAGLATGIGSAAVFFPSIVKLANRQVLAASLGLSAGVMTYISLVDIYTKSIGGFEEQGHEEGNAFIYATISFFGGTILMLGMNAVVTKLMGEHHHDELDRFIPSGSSSNKKACSKDTKLDEIKDMAEEIENRESDEQATDENTEAAEKEVESNTETNDTEAVDTTDGQLEKPLMQLGIKTALAIALHNFPEGLVTFVSYVEDPAVGIVLAAGIAIHNIPEGLCVAMPIYYATDRRWYAFFWGILSGLTEPIGALIGWGIFSSSFSGNTYGIVFGIVSGMMTVIAIDELLPAAHKYDPQNTVVTYAFLIGAFLVALSLMLFSV